MDIESVMQKTDKLIQDLNQIISSASNQSPKQLDEHLKNWEARAFEVIRDSGFGDAANRFAMTSHRTKANDYLGNLFRKAEAKKASLIALLADMKSNSDFYEQKLKKQIPVAEVTQVKANNRVPSAVFLGHGRSALWAKVQLFLEKDLKLKVEVWEAQSREGKHTIEVLKQLLESSGFAVLVMTGEDETQEGELRARQNVIHEIGLFQGRLGFDRVALLEQEGVEGCSNLLGLQAIRFRGEDIESTFYRLQKMLQREGLL
jgi:predicted nucleotide-binding protein